jgi:cell division protein FtsB
MNKEEHILQEEMGKLGKKGYARQCAIEKMVIALTKEYKKLSEEIKLIKGDIELLK